jgi:large subunit ribosomal protein L5
MQESLKVKYNKEIRQNLIKKFGYKNVNLVPKLEKIVINCVSKDAVSNSKTVDVIVNELAAISGQKPVVVKAKKSIAVFKLRQGQPMGATVTLRGERMYDFLQRLIGLSLPRVRDFRGINPKCFDDKGNYTLGIKEQIIFPEINYDKIEKVRGMGICFVTTAKNSEEGRELLKSFGVPFRQ